MLRSQRTSCWQYDHDDPYKVEPIELRIAEQDPACGTGFLRWAGIGSGDRTWGRRRDSLLSLKQSSQATARLYGRCVSGAHDVVEALRRESRREDGYQNCDRVIPAPHPDDRVAGHNAVPEHRRLRRTRHSHFGSRACLAIEHGHLALVIAVAGHRVGRHCALDGSEVILAELKL